MRNRLLRLSVHDDPRFADVRDAYDRGVFMSREVEGSDGKLFVVSEPRVVMRWSDGTIVPVGAKGLYIEYRTNPDAAKLDTIVNGQIAIGPKTRAKGVIRPNTKVKLLVGFGRANPGGPEQLVLDIDLDFNHPLVQKAWERYQTHYDPATHYTDGRITREKMRQLPFADPYTLTHARNDEERDIEYTTWRAAPIGVGTRLWASTLNPASYAANPSVLVTVGGSPWFWNRWGGIETGAPPAKANNRHYFTGTAVDHRASQWGNDPLWTKYGAAIRNDYIYMGTYEGSKSFPTGELPIEVLTAPGQMVSINGSTRTAISWQNNKVFLKAIPLGDMLFYDELLDGLDQASIDTLEYVRLNPNGKHTRDLFTLVYLPLSRLEEPNEEDYYTPQKITFNAQLSALSREVLALDVDDESVVDSVTVSSENFTDVTAGDLPVAFDDPEDMEARVAPWPLTVEVTLSGKGHKFYEAVLTYSAEETGEPFTPYIDEAPGGEPPLDWRDGDFMYRAVTHNWAIARHPLMPGNLHDMRVFNAYTGEDLHYAVYGDYLVFAEGKGPYEVYFGLREGSYYSYFPYSLSAQDLSGALSLQGAPPKWDSVESWYDHRNLVRPLYQVIASTDFEGQDGIDLTPYLADLSDGSISLYGAGNFWTAIPSDPQFPAYVRVTSNGLPVYQGLVTRISSEPSASGRGVTLSPVTTLQFFNLDLEVLNRENIPLNPDTGTEDEFLVTLLRRAGYPGKIYYGKPIDDDDTPLRFRDMGFWLETPDNGGPGFIEEEFEGTYWNSTGGTVLQEARNLVNANMLDLYQLPSGDLLIDAILPVPHKDIERVFQEECLRYCVDADGNWVNDPRLHLEAVELGLDDTFSRIEVEGMSNEVSLSIMPMDAPFVQIVDGNSVERRYLEKTMPGLVIDTSMNPINGSPRVPSWPPLERIMEILPFSTAYQNLSPNNRPWLFMQMDQGSPALVAVPTHWFGVVGLTGGSGDIEVQKIEGGNRWVNSKGFIKVPISAIQGDRPGGGSWANYLISTLGAINAGIPNAPTVDGNTKVAIGIWASATGLYWAEAVFEFRVKIPMPDAASIRIEPHLGKFDSQFRPKWLPNVESQIAALESKKPRRAKRIQNPYIAAIGAEFATQMYTYDGDLSVYNAITGKTTAAAQLATWLTIREFLNTRRVRVSFAGACHWAPNQFLAIARRPPEGVGGRVEYWDILLVNDVSSASAKVGAEAWVTADCSYIAAVRIDPDYDELVYINGIAQVSYDMPIGWSGVWEGPFEIGGGELPEEEEE